MEMQNVIGQQFISHRHKPVRIPGDTGLVRPARNGQIGQHIARSFRDKPRPGRLQAVRPFKRAGNTLSIEAVIKNGSLGLRNFARHAETALIRATKPIPVRTRVILLSVVAVVLFAGSLASTGALEKKVNLYGFMLPEDTRLSALLLDPPILEDVATDDVAGSPALPMTVSLSSYKVVRNDTLDAISRRFGIRLDTIISINGIADVRRLVPGTSLKIPNMDGIVHTVRKGENLSTIASSRGIAILDLIDANDLASQTIQPGQTLFIPGARLSSYDLKKALGQLVIWPASGRISSYFGYRPNPFTGVRHFHSGIDIVAPENSSTKAAMSGRVAETGYSALYGNFVILTHPEGYQTLYAHLNKIKVKTGSSIEQGDSVGLVGSTGYSTGTHLHFGVFKNGKALDPVKFLGSTP